MAPKEILDFIPQDVHKRVATYIRFSSNHNALKFAKQSEQQRRSMVEALDYALVLSDDIRSDISKWIDIFGGDVRTLDTSRLTYIRFPIELLSRRLPNLRAAKIFGATCHLRGVKQAPQLKSLKVVMFYGMNLNVLIETCRSLPLKELTLECECDGININCAHKEIGCEELRMLGMACPSVTKLDMIGHCDDTIRLSPMVFSMRSLKHLSLHARISNEDVKHLHEFEEVEFHENIAIRQVVKLGASVTTVTQRRRASIETVRLLSKLPFLKKLQLAMLDGAEKALPQLITQVEELDLSWGYDDSYDKLETCNEIEAYGDGDVSFDSDTMKYYPVDTHFLQQILRSAPKLRKLHFRKAVIKSDALKLIMQKIGSNLEELSVHMDQQCENPVERVLKIMHAGFTWCPNAKKINLLGETIERRATYHKKQSCYTALRLLQSTSVFIDATNLRKYIDGIRVLWKLPQSGLECDQPELCYQY